MENPNRPLISLPEAFKRAGISKSAGYRAVATGVFPGLVKWPGARLPDAILTGADLTGANLFHTDLRTADSLTAAQVRRARHKGKDALLPDGFWE